jgi:hypothetical protein
MIYPTLSGEPMSDPVKPTISTPFSIINFLYFIMIFGSVGSDARLGRIDHDKR